MKKKRYTRICLVTVLLAILVASCFVMQSNCINNEFFFVEIISGDSYEQIRTWENENGEIFAFLPSYANLEGTVFRKTNEIEVFLNDQKVEEGMKCKDLDWNTPYELAYRIGGKDYQQRFTIHHSANLPTMYIDTESNSMKYVHAKKGNKESGEMRIYSDKGEIEYLGDIESINGRGNYTWDNFEKKPYSITLKEDANLLGMGAATEWILLANADDPSHMRNKIVYDFADKVGMTYSPDSSWVDLYLNGEYAGLYLLCERNEIHPERVDIDSEDGALVSLELEERMKSQGNTYIVTDNNQALRIHSFTNEEEKILQRFQAIENALLAQDGMDSVSGQKWNELIDVDSWVRKYLIEEIFANYDACYISQFFYFDAQTDGKVYAGPVWDYDLSMGSTLYWPYSTPQEYYGYRLKVQEGIQRPWFYQLYQKDEFRQRVEELFRDEFLLKVESMLSNGLNDSAIMLEQSAKMNQIRWSVDDSINDGIDQIREYMEERLDFLRKAWVEKKEYKILQANPGIAHYVYYAVQPGQRFTGLPELNNTAGQLFCGWYYENTDEPFDSSRPIYEDTAVYAKWEDTPHKQLETLNKILPAGIIAIMFMVILAVEMRRIRKGG